MSPHSVPPAISPHHYCGNLDTTATTAPPSLSRCHHYCCPDADTNATVQTLPPFLPSLLLPQCCCHCPAVAAATPTPLPLSRHCCHHCPALLLLPRCHCHCRTIAATLMLLLPLSRRHCHCPAITVQMPSLPLPQCYCCDTTLQPRPHCLPIGRAAHKFLWPWPWKLRARV
jgi:hypothetical protein